MWSFYFSIGKLRLRVICDLFKVIEQNKDGNPDLAQKPMFFFLSPYPYTAETGPFTEYSQLFICLKKK